MVQCTYYHYLHILFYIRMLIFVNLAIRMFIMFSYSKNIRTSNVNLTALVRALACVLTDLCMHVYLHAYLSV